MNRTARSFLFAAGLALGGCGVVHSVNREPEPPVSLSEAFRGGVATSSVAEGQWWKTFEDPALDALMADAVRANLDIRRTRALVKQANAIRRRENSAWYPQADLSLNASRSRSAFQFGAFENNQFDVSVAASYEADLWGRVYFTTTAAALDLEAERFDLERLAMTVSAEVADTWFQVVEQRVTHRLLLRQLETNQTFLKLVEFRFGQGQVGALDVYQQRQQVAAIEAQLPQAGLDLGVAENRLAVLVGRSPSQLGLPSATALPPLPPAPALGVPANLLQRRPDIRAAEARVLASDHRVGAAFANLFPTLRLTGSVGTRSFDNPENLFDLDNLIWNLAAGIFAPLFDGLRRRAEVARTEGVLEATILAYGQTLLVAVREVEDALVRERFQKQRVVEVDKQVRLARETLDQARNRYINGLIEYLPVLDALQNLQRLERDRVRARRLLLSYRVQLHRALGGDWPAEILAEDSEELATADRGGEEQR